MESVTSHQPATPSMRSKPAITAERLRFIQYIRGGPQGPRLRLTARSETKVLEAVCLLPVQLNRVRHKWPYQPQYLVYFVQVIVAVIHAQHFTKLHTAGRNHAIGGFVKDGAKDPQQQVARIKNIGDHFVATPGVITDAVSNLGAIIATITGGKACREFCVEGKAAVSAQ